MRRTKASPMRDDDNFQVSSFPSLSGGNTRWTNALYMASTPCVVYASTFIASSDFHRKSVALSRASRSLSSRIAPFAQSGCPISGSDGSFIPWRRTVSHIFIEPSRLSPKHYGLIGKRLMGGSHPRGVLVARVSNEKKRKRERENLVVRDSAKETKVTAKIEIAASLRLIC